jgi:hypothetical protein
MSRHLAIVSSVLMLAIGAAGAASAAVNKKPVTHVTHPRSQASLQCSSEANAKGLHGKARTAFRHDCLRRATYHKPMLKKVHPTASHQKAEKIKKTS